MSSHRRSTGRDAILDAAAVLMDERGVDNVSLNQINSASGNRNRSAITYHFGSREALVHQLAARTMEVLNSERESLLDHLERSGAPLTARQAVEVICAPLTGALGSIEGRRFLRLCGQLINHPTYNADARQALMVNSSIQRSAAHLGGALAHLPPAIALERASQIIGFLVRAYADQARLIDADQPPRPPLDARTYTVNLVDLVLAMMATPSTASDNPGDSGA